MVWPRHCCAPSCAPGFNVKTVLGVSLRRDHKVSVFAPGWSRLTFSCPVAPSNMMGATREWRWELNLEAANL